LDQELEREDSGKAGKIFEPTIFGFVDGLKRDSARGERVIVRRVSSQNAERCSSEGRKKQKRKGATLTETATDGERVPPP